MQNSVAKKIFAVGSAVAMTLSLVAPFAAQAAAHAAGTNVKSSDGTIWMISPEGTRRAYTSAGAFLSYGFNSWASVVDANADDLALPAGAFIPPQDGKVMCSDRGSDKGTCYLVTGAMKAGFTSAAVFTGLGFSFSKAGMGDLSWMTSTTNIDSSTQAHRPGVLVNNNGTVQLVGANGLLGIPDLATFNSWGYSFANVVPANDADKAMTQTGVMAARVAGQLSPTALVGGNNPPVVSGSVSATLASDNPAGGTIVASSSAVTLAKFSFSGTGTVTQLQVKRIGVSADTVLSNVYLYDGGMRLTDAASVGGNSLITFNNPNGLFTVSGNKTIAVVSEIGGSATSGQTVGVQLTSFTVANGSAASVSISGNMFTISSVSDLSTVNFGAITPANSSFDPAADTEIFRSNAVVGTRDVTLSRLAIRQIASVSNSDIRNLRLRIDGTQVAQVQNLTSDGYAYFTFSPVTLKSGTRVFSVLADVVGGSSRYFHFQIRNKVDVDFTDSNYGVVIGPTYDNGNFPASVTTGATNGDNLINSGNLTFQRATDSPSGDVVKDSSNALLAKYVVTAYGEPMKIETLDIGATSSLATVGSLRNGRVLINGSQYGSTATLSKCTNTACTTGGTQFTINYTVQPGTPVNLEIRADVFDNDGANSLVADATLTAYVMDGSSNVQKTTSLGYASLPASPVSGSTLTVKTGAMTLTKNNNYSNQTTPLPRSGYKLGSFNLAGSSSEDINVTTFEINAAAATYASSTDFDYSELTDVTVKIAGNNFGTVKSTLSSGTSTFSGNYTLTKNTTVAVEVWANLNTPSGVGATGEYVWPAVSISGTTINSSTAVYSSVQGQKITYGSGNFTAAKDGSSPDAAILADEQTKTTAAFKVTTSNDSYTITEVTVDVAAVTSVLNVILKDGSTVLGTKPGSTSVTFSGLSIPVTPGSSGKVLTVDLQLGSIGNGAGTSNEDVTTTLANIKYTDGQGATGNFTTDIAGNAMYAFASIPTVTNVALPETTLTQGTKQLSKFTLSSGGTGNISWNKVIITVSKSANVTLLDARLINADTNQAITGTMATSTNFGATGTASGTYTFTVTSNGGEESITSKTYALEATVGGTLTTGDFVTAKIAAGQSSHQATATTTGVAGSPTFVWSDQSATSHATTTSDWFGDFLVKNIPTSGQSMTK